MHGSMNIKIKMLRSLTSGTSIKYEISELFDYSVTNVVFILLTRHHRKCIYTFVLQKKKKKKKKNMAEM